MFGIFKKQFDPEEHELAISEWDEYIGQDDLKEKLSIAIEAAKQRNGPPPHCLFASLAGHGKSTIAQIMAKQYGTECKTYISTAIKEPADLVEICTKAEENSIHFLDECHELSRSVQTMMLSVLQDKKITIKSEKSLIHIPVKPFCFVAATTNLEKLSDPFKNRFGILHTLSPYTQEEIALILKQSFIKIGYDVDQEILEEIAKRSRLVPRNANRLALRIRDFCQVKNNNQIDMEAVNSALELEGIDDDGLTKKDWEYLRLIYDKFGGGPCGVASLASMMGEKKEFLERDIEPFLSQKELLSRTARGRILTQKAINLIL